MTLKTPEPQKSPEETHEKFDYVRFASDLATPHLQQYFAYFQDLKISIKKADINMSLEDYISVAAVTSAAVSIPDNLVSSALV